MGSYDFSIWNTKSGNSIHKSFIRGGLHLFGICKFWSFVNEVGLKFEVVWGSSCVGQLVESWNIRKSILIPR